jgi:hypothetical protein
MKIVDLSPEHEALYCICLEDWSEDMNEAGDHKAIWYDKMKERGLRVKLAEDERGWCLRGLTRSIETNSWNGASPMLYILMTGKSAPGRRRPLRKSES